jgi:hypothetical protein
MLLIYVGISDAFPSSLAYFVSKPDGGIVLFMIAFSDGNTLSLSAAMIGDHFLIDTAVVCSVNGL